MKTLYLLHTNSLYQGSTRSILSTVRLLKEKGVVPVLLLPKSDSTNELLHELVLLGVKFYFYKFRWPVFPKRNTIKDQILYLPRLIKLILSKIISTMTVAMIVFKEKPSIIHSNVGIITEGYYISKIFNLPHFWHLREYQDLDFNLQTLISKEAFLKKLNSSLNYPIAISNGIAQHFYLSESKVIYNGILSSNEVRFIPNKENYFLFVGQLTEAKGIGSLLHVFAEFMDLFQSFRLVIVGDTKDSMYKNYLEELCVKLSIVDNVDFRGNISQQQVSSLMSKAFVLIVPSIYEAFGRITAEAIFNGCFVVGRNTGGTQEIISCVGGGILFEEDSQLIGILTKLVENGITQYSSDIRHAQQKALRLYSIEQNAERILDYYREALAIVNVHKWDKW